MRCDIRTKDPISGINPSSNSQIQDYKLEQNFPNPFNPITKINFEIPKTSYISLRIFDVAGKEVSDLINEIKNPGKYSINFDGTNFASGTYFCRLESNEFILIKKMLLIK